MIKKYLIDRSKAIYSLKQRVINTFKERGGLSNDPHHYILKLFYSKLGKGWADKVSGKMAASLENNGNGITVFFRGKKTISLDYGELHELRILLREHDLVSSASGTVEVTEILVNK